MINKIEKVSFSLDRPKNLEKIKFLAAFAFDFSKLCIIIDL